MRRDSTTYAKSRQDAQRSEAAPTDGLWQHKHFGRLALAEGPRVLAAMVLGVALFGLVYQLPVTHSVDIGGYDSAYVQGFYDPERNAPAENRPALAGSDGSARWTRDVSYLLFPQAGLPAQLTLRLRGWRAEGPAPAVVVKLNGARELGRFHAGRDWQDYTFSIDGGLLKPNDVVIEIDSETAQTAEDPRALGVLLDQATYRVGPGPIIPYPPQLLYGALAAGMLYLLLVQNRKPRIEDRGWRITRSLSSILYPLSSILTRPFLLSLVVLCLLFQALYRAQPPYPYPLLRLLPAIDGLLAAALALRYGPALARRIPVLLDGLAIGGIGAWVAAVLAAAQRHITLSVPGVEKDFRVFATRSEHLFGAFGAQSKETAGVIQADGFYNLGYPLLLWLTRPLANDNPFLAARLVAALSGALLLGATWWLARRLLGRGPALLALLALALSPLVVEYALYLGTDMPFAALCTLALALLLPTTDDRRPTTDDMLLNAPSVGREVSARNKWLIALAGLVAGLAFLMRHPGLLLLPFGWLAIWRSSTLNVAISQSGVDNTEGKTQNSKLKTQNLLVFTLAFLIAIAPQLAVNIAQTGQPFYNQQAKNIWQGVFGDGDWGRWAETANDITLGSVIAQSPDRFLANWWANLRGYIGAGGEDTSEFGHAAQLRLLGFPANWLAIAGLIGWLLFSLQSLRQGDGETERRETSDLLLSPGLLVSVSLLLLWTAVYILAISPGLPLLPRFILPLAPIYAIAAAWATTSVQAALRGRPAETLRGRPLHGRPAEALLLAGLLLLVLLWGGFAAGAGYVLNTRPPAEADQPGQPAEEVAAIQLVRSALRPGETLIVRVDPRVAIGKYSAIAHLVAPAPATDDSAALRATGAGYLLWDTRLGPAPAVGQAVGNVEIFTLYRINP